VSVFLTALYGIRIELMSLAARCANPDRLTTLSLPEMFDVSAAEQFLEQLEALGGVQSERISIDFRNTLYVDRTGLNLLKMARRQFGETCRLQAINLNGRATQCLIKLSADHIISFR